MDARLRHSLHPNTKSCLPKEKKRSDINGTEEHPSDREAEYHASKGSSLRSDVGLGELYSIYIYIYAVNRCMSIVKLLAITPDQ